jgi:hypothetical protein
MFSREGYSSHFCTFLVPLSIVVTLLLGTQVFAMMAMVMLALVRCFRGSHRMKLLIEMMIKLSNALSTWGHILSFLYFAFFFVRSYDVIVMGFVGSLFDLRLSA